MDLGLKGKWALVCGASRGLGWGCAQALAQEGANVLMVARRADVLDAGAAQIRAALGPDNLAQVQVCAQDITTEAGRAAVFALGHTFDIVVTNAGGPPSGNFRDWDRADWIRAVDANMLTPIELMKATVDGMSARGFGRIINITSSSVKAPIDALGLSNGARSGLTGFVAGLARSGIAARGVTVNNILPGAFDTDRLNGLFAVAASKSGQTVDALAAQRRKGIPAQRFGTPEEFGVLCAFLCSPKAGYITGQNLLLDGGAFTGTF